MNTEFLDRPQHPIQWTVLDDRSTDSHFLIGVWRHLAGDAKSMCLLFRRVLNEYYGTIRLEGEDPMPVMAPNYSSIMRPHYRRLGYLKTLVRAIQLRMSLRQVHRMHRNRVSGEETHVQVTEAPPGIIGRLVAASKTHRVTVNDLFLAALGKSIAGLTPQRRDHPHQRKLALAAPVDLRPVAREKLSQCFGLHLSHWITLIDQPDQDIWHLLSGIAEQTRLEKAEQRFAGPPWIFFHW